MFLLQNSRYFFNSRYLAPRMYELSVLNRELHTKLWGLKLNVLLTKWLKNDKVTFHKGTEEAISKPVVKQSSFRIVNWFTEDFLNGRIKINAFLLYASLTDQVNYLEFMTKCNMPDTFNSWFLITELHLWMLLTRVRGEGKKGKLCSSSVVAAFWDDTIQRAKVLAPNDTTARKKQLNILVGEFKASLLIYDEAYLSNDMILASALWFRFFEKENVDPRILELLIKYIRKQMHNLDTISNDDIILKANINWSLVNLK